MAWNNRAKEREREPFGSDKAGLAAQAAAVASVSASMAVEARAGHEVSKGKKAARADSNLVELHI